MNASEILTALASARNHTKMRGGRRRVVVRMGKVELAQVDAMRAHFPKASRAALIRVLVLIALTMVEEAMAAPPASPEAAP